MGLRRDRAASRWLACACLVASSLVPVPALAYYEEAHVTGDEVKVAVDGSGQARVDHVVSWHVLAGQLHHFELAGAAGSPVPEPAAGATNEEGRVFPATLVPRPGGGLRVVFDEPKGLRHGRYKVHLAYRMSLLEDHALERDGAMWRLTFMGPSFGDGFDSAKVTFSLPASVDEPRPIAGPAGVLLSTLRRAAEVDELELVKPHVSGHEVVPWTIRVSPRAFPDVRDAGLRPPSPRPAPAPAHAGTSSPWALLLAAIGALAYAALVLRHARRFQGMCEAQGAAAEGVVPLAPHVRAAASGIAFGAGLLAECWGAPTAGAAFIAAAMFLACLRPRLGELSLAAPGGWFPLQTSEAFPRTSVLARLRTAAWIVASAAIAGGLLYAARSELVPAAAPRGPYYALLDAVALLPLFVTGTGRSLPSSGASAAARFLRRVSARLSREKSVRVTPWARIPEGADRPDELRVLVLPRAALPGLVGIEVGLAHLTTARSFMTQPEVLVRVRDASPACARMAGLAPNAPVDGGRKPAERVYRLTPRLPTGDLTAGLARRLASALVERRVARMPIDIADRRAPRAPGSAARAA